MKKLLLATSALALVSTSAMASQARLLALGMNETDNEGMYHVSDKRNMFLNPAYINIYNNYVTLELGKNGLYVSKDATGATPSTTTLDRDQKNKAQGGFMKKHGDYVYGVYLGNESNTSSMLRIVGTSATAAINSTTTASTMLNSADNQFDLFFGGDNGVKWGSNVTFSRDKDDSRKAKDMAAALRLGAMGERWDAHLNLSLASKAEATDATNLGGVTEVSHEFKGKLGFQLGGSYNIVGNQKVFGYVKHYSWEQTDSSLLPGTTPIGGGAVLGGQNGTVKGDFTSVYAGWGTHQDINDTDKVYLSVAGKKTDINAKFANKGEVRTIVVPVSVGYEAVATEWLTLRGSVTQNLWSSRDNKNYSSINPVGRNVIANAFGAEGKGTLANSTDVRAGATVKFGNNTELDGMVAVKDTSSLEFLRVGLTYNF